MANDNHAIDPALYDRAIEEIRRDFISKNPDVPSAAAASAIARHAERAFHIMWQSALSTHAIHKTARAAIRQTGLSESRQEIYDGLNRDLMVLLMTKAGMSKATAERIVDNHILSH